MSFKLTKLTKQVVEEGTDLIAGRADQWLKQLIKGIPSIPKPHIKQEISGALTPSGTPTGPKFKRKKLGRKKLREELPFHGGIDTPGSSIQETLDFKKEAERELSNDLNYCLGGKIVIKRRN